MTKEELAKQSFDSVRRDPALFGLFKKYVAEDAGLIYASGKLPAGCFGCQSRNIFSRWANIYREKTFKPTKITNAMSTEITYELKNKASKYFFAGKVLSNKSTDAEWIRWVDVAKSKEERERRLALFSKLPKGLDKQAKAVKEEAVEEVEVTTQDVVEVASTEEVEVTESEVSETEESNPAEEVVEEVKPKKKRTKKASK